MPSRSPAMTPEAWARLTDLFGHALDASPDERRDYLARLRADDPGVAVELEALLDAHDRPGEFLPELPAAATPTDLSGRTVGAYRLIRLIGSGGMGTVYLAERSDGAFSKQVAVKLLSAAFIQLRDRFQREREVLACLEHPNIARLLDAGTAGGDTPYIVMEYVEGVPIDRYYADRDLPVDERLALLLQVCAGVAHAHQNLIVHCDIKPENILVRADGVVKLLDFGIARLLNPDRAVTLFRPGTPAYASPEQLRGEVVSTATDVYSIGVLAYLVLTGSAPYPQRSGRLEETMHAVLSSEPLRASAIPGLPAARARRLRGDLDNVLLKAVAKDPRRRYASVQQLADDFEAFRKGFPVRARADSFTYRVRKSIGRHRVAYAAVGLAGLGLLGAATYSTWQARVAQRRFEDLRAFAHAVVFDVNDALSPIPGTTAPRKLLVETALTYLDRLNAEGQSDPSLREELAAAYIRVGKVQGGAFLPNLGDAPGAIASFRKAIGTIGPAGTTPALERLRIEALISIAQLAEDPIRGAPDFDAAIDAAQRLLHNAPSDLANMRLLADAYHGRSTVAHLTGDVQEHRAMASRQIEVRERIRSLAPGRWQDDASLARALAQHAQALEYESQHTKAIAELRAARSILEAAAARFPGNQMVLRGVAEIRSRIVVSLVATGAVAEAQAEVEAAVRILEPLVASDPRNIQYKADLAFAWRRLGDARRAAGDLVQALEFHTKALDVRRERADRHSGFIFVPWELTRSLNTVAELLMLQSPPKLDAAAAMFAEARDAAARVLAVAPSYAQVRRQLIIAEEGIEAINKGRLDSAVSRASSVK